ncbi:MAG: alpha/beta hydrolase [Nitratireductor sp.]|nr:alpha/beta hydrolase [Nitratireductor sp.]
MPATAPQPKSVYVQAGQHEIHVTQWGDPANPALVMWHGLARTGRDFDELAAALSDDYLVLCPDTLGRGMSAWAGDPAKEYAFSVFGDHAIAILDHYGIGDLRWIGTSMGALIGMTLAGGWLKERISHFVVNDIGPTLPKDALDRIATYAGNPPTFDTIAELENWLRTVYAPFGANPDAFWRRLADTSMRRTDSGKVTVHYDPKMVVHLTAQPQDFDLWSCWDAISARTLVLRGEDSDVLPAAAVHEMQSRGPKPACEVFTGVGHAPTLVSDREISLLRNFLSS